MNRRRFLTTAGTGCVALAGCLAGPDENSGADATTSDPSSDSTTGSDDAGETTGTTTGTGGDGLDGRLTVATYGSFVDAPSSSPGPWLKEAFERQYPNVTLEWETPEQALTHYIQRRQSNAAIDADVYVGLKVPELVRIDEHLSKPLFEPIAPDRLDNADAIEPAFHLDPEERVLPLFTGYCSLVYNGYEVDAPPTLDALTTPEYRGEVTVQSPVTDNTGLYFLLRTVAVFGEDGYLDYWRALLDNETSVLGSWGDVYAAFSAGETSLVTSYSTDQVYASRADADLTEHQVAFPGGHGYTNLSGIGQFATTDRPDLAAAFVDFVLGPEAQGKLAELNVSFPVTDHATVPPVFERYAKVPDDPLLFGYDDLTGRLDGWLDDWSQSVATK